MPSLSGWKWFKCCFTSASATIRALRGLFATHGLPEDLVADNGTQSVAGEKRYFLTANSVRLCLSWPYHPASTAWWSWTRSYESLGAQTEKLAQFLLSYQTAPHTATGCPPADILFGRTFLRGCHKIRGGLSSDKGSRRWTQKLWITRDLLPQTLFQRTTHRLNNSLYRIRSLPRPCLKFRHLDGLFRKKKCYR